MAEYKWIKLYHEILEDPKMGRMDDHHYRRCIEFFLVAGRSDQQGILPSIADLAWLLRTSRDDIQETIDYLISVDILEVVKDEDGSNVVNVTNFIKRQEMSLTGAERVKRYRQKSNVTDVTQSCYKRTNTDASNVTVDKDIDIDKDKEGDKEGDIYIFADAKKSQTSPDDVSENPKKESEKNQKHRYGEFQHVFLSNEEIEKLKLKFPGDYAERIQKMDSGIEMKGYKYKNHYLALLNWAKNDEKWAVDSKKSVNNDTFEAAAKRMGII